jgi:lysophospholipase L1-like esterase
MWLLVGVLVLLGGQPSEAGTGVHSRTDQTARAPVRQYAALGDSYTAGSGIPSIEDETCSRSTRNYPHLLAVALGAHLRDASCGGAQTAAAEGYQPNVGAPIPPQLAGVDADTDLVTISLGINDAGFSTVLYRCFALASSDPQGAPCRTAFRTSGGDSVAALLPDVRDRLVHVIEVTRSRAPRARIMVVGYPQLVPASGTCAALPFARGDYSYVRAFFSNVDKVMQAAARETRATYVDMLTASKGHSACSTRSPWVEGAVGSSTALPFHPRPSWHRAVTRMVLETLTGDS